MQLSDDLKLDRQMRHHIEVVIDRLIAGPTVRARLAEAVELALRLGEGELIVAVEGTKGRKSESESEKGGRRKAEGGKAETNAEEAKPFPIRHSPFPF